MSTQFRPGHQFRAWDRVKKEFYLHLWLNSDGMFTNQEYPAEIDKPKAQYIWEQFTGLKDKNGKEIYEGDVLTLFDTNERWLNGKPQPNQDNVIVVWDKHDLAWRAEYCESRGNLFCAGSNSAWRFFEKEIIGNIHENQELLKK